MLNRMMLGGLLLLIVIVATTARLVPHGNAAVLATPQHEYLRMLDGDALIAKP